MLNDHSPLDMGDLDAMLAELSKNYDAENEALAKVRVYVRDAYAEVLGRLDPDALPRRA